MSNEKTESKKPVVKETLATKPVEKSPVVNTTSAEDAALSRELLDGAFADANEYNGGAGGRLTLRELIMTYFSPTDLVRVTNPFDFNTGWVYSDPKDIKIEQPSPETRRVYGIGREFAKTRILRAGDELVIPGWEAYVGLTRFFKEWCQRKHSGRIEVMMNSSLAFKQFMEKVYLGLFDPNEGKNSKIDNEEAARIALENDLGLSA